MLDFFYLQKVDHSTRIFFIDEIEIHRNHCCCIFGTELGFAVYKRKIRSLTRGAEDLCRVIRLNPTLFGKWR